VGRIRTIKPEFPQSETIGSLSRDARLLFIQLWTLVDDDGRARANSRMLASLLYPYDSDARDLIDGWLAELGEKDCVRLYEVDGAHYLEIPNWLKHQKVDHSKPSKLPPYVANNREQSRSIAPDPRIIGPIEEAKASSCLKSRKRKTRKTDYTPLFETFWTAFPDTNGTSKVEAFAEWEKLADDDRDKAIAVLPSFKTWIAKQGKDYRVVHPCRYLSQRRFDSFEEKPKMNGTPKIYVQYGTDAGDAWDQWHRTRGKMAPRDGKGGWWFETEFPPAEQAA
jgi:hypothetical protein